MAGAGFEVRSQDSIATVPESIGRIFDKNCKGCHNPEEEEPHLNSGSLVAELISSEMIIPGEPENSPLVQLVLLEETNRKRMPRSKGKPGDKSYRSPLSDAEKKELGEWVAGLGKTETKTTMVEKIKEFIQVRPETIKSASIGDDVLPEGNLELQAQAILNRNCKKCHNPDKRNRPPLQASRTELVKLGADKDILGRIQLSPGDDDVMPPEPHRRLTREETEILGKWFSSKQESSGARELIASTETIQSIYKDLMTDEGSARFFRYFTLTNLYNATGRDGNPVHSDVRLKTYRAGLAKLMNSLSLHGKITVPKAIDARETIYRIDLRDYKWKPEDWERVVTFYPHGIIGVDAQKEKIISHKTESRMAYLRADWFAFAAAQPPLYDDILDQLLGIYSPENENAQQRLEKGIGVDRVANLQAGKAVRAGFLKSGVSDHNRLIERHESNFGAYWVSYDFKRVGSDASQDLRKSPLGPPEANLTQNKDLIFRHDGGEMIYTLPNGLQAYLLATFEGTRLDRAPNEIVRDNNRPDGTIVNGISCIKCHDRGIKGAIKVPFPSEGIETWDEKAMGEPNPRTPAGMKDEIRPFVEASAILGGRDLGLFQKLHPSKTELRRLVMLDYQRFNEANDQAINRLVSAEEPVSALYDSYYLEPVNAHILAAEFGMDFAEMMKLLEAESFQSEGFRTLFHSLKAGSAEARDQVLQECSTIAYTLGYQLMPFEPLGYEEFGGAAFAELIRKSPAFVASMGSGKNAINKNYDEVQQDHAKIKKALTQSPPALHGQSSNTVLLPGGGKMTVEVESVIKVGGMGNLKITSDRSIFLYVLHRGSGTEVTQFFPNAALQNNRIDSSGPEVTKTISFQTSPPAGPEVFEIYASSAPISVNIPGTRAGNFTTFDRTKFFDTRGIATALSATDTTKKKSDIPDSLTKARVGYLLKDQ